MKIRIIFALVSVCLFACVEKSIPEPLNGMFRLTKEEINQLIDLLDASSDAKLNFHIVYSEQLNDSTAIVNVWQNQFKANRALGVCEIGKYKKSHVFLYDSTKCNISVPDCLSSSRTESPYFILHAPHWMVLAKRRGKEIIYYEVSFFLKTDETLEVSKDAFEN